MIDIDEWLKDKECKTCHTPALDCDVYFPAFKQCGKCAGTLDERQQKRFVELFVSKAILKEE